MPANCADPRDRMFFFEAAPQACIVLGEDLRIRDVNYAFTALTGWTLTEVLRRDVRELMDPEASEALQAVLGAPDWGRVDTVQARVKCRVGEPLPLQWHVRGLPARRPATPAHGHRPGASPPSRGAVLGSAPAPNQGKLKEETAWKAKPEK